MKEMRPVNNDKAFCLPNNFMSWYFHRDTYLRVYGEPSDSDIIAWNKEVTAFHKELEAYKGVSTTTAADVNMFESFLKDDSDEAESNKSDVLEYYYETTIEYSLVNTCGVLGIITGCIKNDNYEEALEVIVRYKRLTEHQQHLDWVAAGKPNRYPVNVLKPETTVAATLRILNVLTGLLYGDEPELDQCITLCDSFYADLLEHENGKV